MYAAIRHPIVTSVEEATQRINEDLLPNILEKLPGYKGFYLYKVSEQEFYSLTLFETKEQAEESNRAVLDWIQRGASDIVIKGPEPVIGELTISTMAKPGQFPGEMAA